MSAPSRVHARHERGHASMSRCGSEGVGCQTLFCLQIRLIQECEQGFGTPQGGVVGGLDERPAQTIA
jgi:hypothetical protein